MKGNCRLCHQSKCDCPELTYSGKGDWWIVNKATYIVKPNTVIRVGLKMVRIVGKK